MTDRGEGLQPDVFLRFGPLEKAFFIERPNRFLICGRMAKTGNTVTAHLADPGRLRELLVKGAVLYLRRANAPQRKTKWSAVLVEAPNGVLVSLQSTLVNKLTGIALQKQALKELNPWRFVRSEFTLGNSRWDFLLEKVEGKKQLILEVKSVSLVKQGVALFPDAVTKRGRRHLEELAYLQEQTDFDTAVLFLVQRSDALKFRPADDIDPLFGERLRRADHKGVKILVRDCQVTLESVHLGKPLSAELF